MLASIIANLQNAAPAEIPKRLPVKVDRGGGGPTWPGYEAVDIMTAVRLFPEIANEDPTARVVRRLKWIGESLPFISEVRQRREAVAFLAGAVVGDAAAEERHRVIDAVRAAQASWSAREAAFQSTDVPVEQLDRVRDTRPKYVRGQYKSGGSGGGGSGLIIAALAIVAIGTVMLARRQ